METVVIRLGENARCYLEWGTNELIVFNGTFPSEIYYQKAPGEVFNVFKMTQFAGNGVNFIMRILNLQSNTRSQMFCNPDFVVWSEDDHFKDKVFNITRCLEKIDVVPFPT